MKTIDFTLCSGTGKFSIAICAIVLLFTGCKIDTTNEPKIMQWGNICSSCAEPNLFRSDDGDILLSWLSHENDTTFHLQYAEIENGIWTTPETVATGRDWFVNWADFPSMATYHNDPEAIVAHWLKMSADGTYDYDVKISQSTDGGLSWSPAFTPHTDGISAEHGFVSLLPLSEERMFATWLDGRNTKTGDIKEDHSHGHGGGAMTLRSAIFDKSGNLYDEAELDTRVCDCCQTSAAKTKSGIIVAYRDRSEKEIRDISVVRTEGGSWSEPKTVFSDNWFIPGCPVNGPVIKASESQVAVAWFAMNDTIPEVKIAFSNDEGRNFSLPFKVDHGDPLGRVGLEFINDSDVLVSWLENGSENASIYAIRINEKGPVGNSFQISETKASRRSGFPVITKYGENMIAAWTHVDSITSVKTALIKL